MRIAPGHARELEAIQLFGDAAMTFEARQALGGEGEIFPQRHVREEGVVLKNVGAAALLRRKVDGGAGVEEDAVVEENAAGIGA